MPAARRLRLAVLLPIALIALEGCAPRLIIDSPPTVHPRADEGAVPGLQRPTVQLRYFGFSPEVTVVAWHPEENRYGLRSMVRRDGTVVSDHDIFVSSYLNAGMPFAVQAVLDKRNLLLSGVSFDLFRCWFGDCSPTHYFSARIPDAVLRNSVDELSVKFYGREGREMVVTLQPELVATYLATVDSVTAALRKRR